MTDSETFDDLVASFPFTLDDLRLLHLRCRNLVGKAQNGPPAGHADGTLDVKSWRQMRALTNALRDLVFAAEDLAADRDPEDDIPF